jgi:hypothetical protein
MVDGIHGISELPGSAILGRSHGTLLKGARAGTPMAVATRETELCQKRIIDQETGTGIVYRWQYGEQIGRVKGCHLTSRLEIETRRTMATSHRNKARAGMEIEARDTGTDSKLANE